MYCQRCNSQLKHEHTNLKLSLYRIERDEWKTQTGGSERLEWGRAPAMRSTGQMSAERPGR